VRTLLRQAQEAGWLTWQAQSGRGKRGRLTFHTAPETLRNEMMETALNRGQQHNALELAQIAPLELRALLHPFLGGQWQNNTPTLRIPYYRPLEPLHPGFLAGRAEQHLAGQVYSGLTRFNQEASQPQGDLAHHWSVSSDGLCWQFYIRSTLHWHNGDVVETDQLRRRLLMLLALPELARLFSSVKAISQTHPQCLTFSLHRPDYWLPHRLASYCSVLAHPDEPEQGTGPFMLKIFEPELVRIESHHRYHHSHPLLQAIEYWITPQLFEQGLGTSCQHPVQIAIGKPEELGKLRLVSHSISLGFCYLALRQSRRLSMAQAQRVIALIHRSGLLQSLPLGENLITPSEEMLPGWAIPLAQDNSDVPLPSHLTLIYHLPVELHTMAEQLKAALAKSGCELTVIFYDAKSWNGCTDLPQADLFMGDRLIGEMPEYALEQWLRCDALWPALFTDAQARHVQNALDKTQAEPDDEQRIAALKHLFTHLMRDAILTPLFNYQYQVSAPPGVNGIHLNARGWFDFSEAWLPPATR
jgi:MarR-like DNA-binding transcriptional regulator SgrR of sgrS sRNA